ncbi:integral membrane protein [Mycobacterium tuberculosis]|nr:integral membrane protein [Mycobacterium tuberculosis]CNZ72280.1 integral membrane protein [Mycobacterium tuberculosis]
MVALAAVLVASRWLLRPTAAEALSTVALGGSTLIAGSIVWSLPIGREIDAFHGIAQNTSTAGVGYEGYLVWAAAAAMCAPLTLFRSPNAPPIDKTVWRAASRNGLLLIAVWCLGSVAMRLTDLVVAVLLNYPFSRYDSMALAAFDLATAVLAIWLRFNMATEALPARLISSLCGLLCTFTVSRVIVGVVLAPRFQASSGGSAHPVYGNDLAQQITSTFDVVLCGLALSILAAAIVIGRLRQLPQPPHTPALSRPAGSPRIFRSAGSTHPVRPKIYRPPDHSS